MTALFEISGLAFAYQPARPVLQGVNLKVHPGERIAIVGPNGAGKSTLLRLMIGLLRPTAGSIVAFGAERVEEDDFWDVRARCGLVFQDPDDQLFCPTVLEDVAFGPLNLGAGMAEARSRAEAILERLAIGHLADQVPQHLSGGEKRLASLASVLVMEPDVLLLDEPTNALDEGTEARLVDILDGLDQAMVIVSHDHRFRDRLARQHVHLNQGQIFTH